MRWILIIILLPLMKQINGQVTVFQTGGKLVSVDFGFTTTSDIEGLVGPDLKKQEKQFVYPEFSSSSNINGSYDAFYFDSLPILFICQPNTEIIQDVIFIKPIDLVLFRSINMELGVDTFANLLKETNISDMKISTSENSNYWSFEDSTFIYYYHKLLDDNSITMNLHSNDFLSFEKSILVFKETTPDLLLIKHKTTQHYDMKFDSNGNRSGRPLYAPLTETHTNTLVNSRPKLLKFLSSNWVKDGSWIEYYPNHLIRFEGTYKNGKETGWFYYYDQTGKLIETKEYSNSMHQFAWWQLFGLGIMLIFTLVMLKRKFLNSNARLYSTFVFQKLFPCFERL